MKILVDAPIRGQTRFRPLSVPYTTLLKYSYTMSSSRRALLSGLARLARVGGQQASTASSSIATLAVNETSSLASRVRIPALSRGFAAQPAIDSSSGKVTQVRSSVYPSKLAIFEKTSVLMKWERPAISRGDPSLFCSHVVIMVVYVSMICVAHVDMGGSGSDRLESESVQLAPALSPSPPLWRRWIGATAHRRDRGSLRTRRFDHSILVPPSDCRSSVPLSMCTLTATCRPSCPP